MRLSVGVGREAVGKEKEEGARKEKESILTDNLGD